MDKSRPIGDPMKLLRWIVATAITATFGAMIIRQSLLRGALALPSTYDDVSYFIEAARYLLHFYEDGFKALVQDFIVYSAHAPLSAAAALVGYGLFGIENWAGPAANVAFLAVFSAAFLQIARNLPIGQSVLLLIALLGSPYAALAVLWFRPDMICGLIIAVGMLFILLRPTWMGARRDQVHAGLLFAAALWSKPSVFHLTAVLFGVAVFLASMSEFAERRFREPIRASLLTIGTGVFFSLPYFAFGFAKTVVYIWNTAFGAGASIWVQPMPLRDHILFYLTGHYGRISLGTWFFAGGMLIAAAAAIILVERDRTVIRRLALALVALVLTYFAVTIPSFKGPHGYAFAALFMVEAALASVVIASRLPSVAAWVFCVGLLVFSGWQWEWTYARMYGPFSQDFADTRWQILRQAYAAVGEQVEGKRVVLTGPGHYLNYNILAFEYLKKGRKPPAGIDMQTNGDLDQHRHATLGSEFVLAFSPDFTDIIPNLPTSTPKFRADLIKTIEETGMFDPPTRIPDTLRGGEVLIYRAGPVGLGTFSNEENLGPVTGPYPEANLPKVRWGSGGRSVLTAQGSPNGNAALVIQAHTHVQGQSMIILVNGAVAASADVTGTFQGFQVPFSYDGAGKAIIEFRYKVPSSNTVLFKGLAVRESK